MGSNGDVIPEAEEEITVLVTGFAPFRPQNPLNPAWEITRSLPPFLPAKPSSQSPSVHPTPRVRILIHPSPIHVSYKAVRELVPQLWNGRQVDYMIHIGMASGRKWYSVERRGHRDHYVLKDVDGEICEDEGRKERGGMVNGFSAAGAGGRDEEAQVAQVADQDEKVEDASDNVVIDDSEEGNVEERDKWIWEGLPREIETDIDVDEVWKRWRIALPAHDIRISEDAGRYLCDFIYYSSLAELTKREERRRVVFLHVPVNADEEAINNGVDITCELIRGMVESDISKKKLGW